MCSGGKSSPAIRKIDSLNSDRGYSREVRCENVLISNEAPLNNLFNEAIFFKAIMQ